MILNIAAATMAAALSANGRISQLSCDCEIPEFIFIQLIVFGFEKLNGRFSPSFSPR
jgi:hypothetical protein